MVPKKRFLFDGFIFVGFWFIYPDTMNPSRPAGRSGKVNVLILAAPNRVAVRPAAVAKNGTAAKEARGGGTNTSHRARPVVAEDTNSTAEQSIVVVAATPHRQFQRGAKCFGSVRYPFIIYFRLPLRFGWYSKSSRTGIVHTIHTLP